MAKEEDEHDEVLQQYLDEEGLALVPLDFMHELLELMEAYVMQQTGVTEEELDETITRLEELIGEDGMMDLSMEDLIGWVNTLKNTK